MDLPAPFVVFRASRTKEKPVPNQNLRFYFVWSSMITAPVF